MAEIKIRLPDDLKQQVTIAAQKANLSTSAYVVDLLDKQMRQISLDLVSDDVRKKLADIVRFDKRVLLAVNRISENQIDVIELLLQMVNEDTEE